MLIEKRYWSDGMDGDINSRMLSDRAALNIMNARMGNSEFGRMGRIENMPGSTAISQSVRPPYGTDQTIGSCPDIKRGRLIYANYNTFGDHGIYAYDLGTGVTYAVIYDSQVINGLGFDKNYRIDRNMKIVGDLLYWTDNLNRQRKINIERGIKMNHASYVTDYEPYSYPMNQEVISLLKRPPLLPVLINKVHQTSPALNNNFIRNESFEFTARYYYKDGETSVLSTYSALANYNTANQTYNRIDITFQFGEYIDQDVQRVDLITRIGNTNNFNLIKSWDKDNSTDAAEINAHNAGTTALSYSFYNDKTGETIDYTGYGYKPYDSIPILSKTLEVANSKLFLGNNLFGYDTPTVTSLSASFSNDSTSSTNIYDVLNIHWGGSPGTTKYVFYITLPGYVGYYDAGSSPPSDPTAFSSLTYAGATLSEVYAYYVIPPIFLPPSVSHYAFVTVTGLTGSLVGTSAFKSDCPYQLGIVFYDFGDRKSGVVTSDSLIYKTADRGYTITSYNGSLNWSLSNTNALNEIPDWATHYSIVLTRALRTNFFLQMRAKNVTYATKNATGDYEFNQKNYSILNNGIAIDITSLNTYNMGYTFSDGDLVKLYFSGSYLTTLAITGQSGNWIICELQNIGVIGDSTTSPFALPFLFEIYTPYKQQLSEPFYEVGQTFSITNAGTSSRSYSATAGTITGDITFLQRNDGTNDYYVEAMSPNDKFYFNWYTNAGRFNQVLRIGQVLETNSISFSQNYIIGSKVNGLSSFDPLSKSTVPIQCGQIQKLQLTSKIQNEKGGVMLSICEKETASIYLGEVQQYGSNAQTTLTISDQVIGTINVLKGSRGTVNPETVIEYMGSVRWIDANNSAAVEYSVNGLTDVNRYRQTRFFKRYLTSYLSASVNNLDNINGFHHIPTCIDPFYKEFLVTLPALIYSNYANVLPSYSSVPSYATSIIDRFDIFDQLGKTMAFQFEENKWGSNYEYMPEWMDYIQNTLFAFKNGNLYTMNTNTSQYNTFFGVQYPVRICFTGNLNPSMLKDLATIAVESNVIPDFTVALTDYPNTQITDLANSDYTDQQGIFYASFLMDRLSPNASGTADQKLYTGDPLTDFAIKVMLEFQQYNSLIYINFVNIGYNRSRGQSKITNPINT